MRAYDSNTRPIVDELTMKQSANQIMTIHTRNEVPDSVSARVAQLFTALSNVDGGTGDVQGVIVAKQ
jgi:hypothetical protein